MMRNFCVYVTWRKIPTRKNFKFEGFVCKLCHFRCNCCPNWFFFFSWIEQNNFLQIWRNFEIFSRLFVGFKWSLRFLHNSLRSFETILVRDRISDKQVATRHQHSLCATWRKIFLCIVNFFPKKSFLRFMKFMNPRSTSISGVDALERIN